MNESNYDLSFDNLRISHSITGPHPSRCIGTKGCHALKFPINILLIKKVFENGASMKHLVRLCPLGKGCAKMNESNLTEVNNYYPYGMLNKSMSWQPAHTLALKGATRLSF